MLHVHPVHEALWHVVRLICGAAPLGPRRRTTADFCTGHFFPGLFVGDFCFCIFFWRWANFVAGLRGGWRGFFDMAVILLSHSTGWWSGPVEWPSEGKVTGPICPRRPG